MAALGFSTVGANACRFVSFNGAQMYSSVISCSKSGQLLASESSRQCRRYLSSIRPNLIDRYVPSGAVQHNSMQHHFRTRCSCAVSISRRLPSGYMQWLGFATLAGSQQVIEGDVNIQYRHGLPVLTLTLPSRGERCEFALRPVTETVADFCDSVRREDRGVDTIGIYSTDGTRVAGSTSIEHLMRSEFHIRLNDRLYLAKPPDQHASLTSEHIQQLNDVKTLVASLHASLNADEQCLRTERELVAKLETVRQALEPLEKEKQRLADDSEKRTNRWLWMGLALMGVQFGAFARLTWFEYSWDIMEPVTYFATYTAVIGGYAYFVATRIQYEYPDAKERIALNKFYKMSRKKGFDVEKYNRTKESLYELERDLERLRRQPTLASYRNLPFLEQMITVVRDVKSTGSQGEQESVADNKTGVPPDGTKT